MLVIISVSRLHNDGIAIRVARPQHDSNPAQAYPSDSQVRAVLLGFGMSTQEVNSYLKLLAQMGANEQLTLPPMNIPQHELVSRGFRL